METEELSLTIEAETGKVDAIVLAGPAAGQSYSGLSIAERAEVHRPTGSEADSLATGGLDILMISTLWQAT